MPAPVTYALGTPRAATARGGDCRAYDTSFARNVYGPHRFADPSYCRISNGLLRLTVGGPILKPKLTIEGRRPAVTIGDYYTDIYTDIYSGSISTPAWTAMGTLEIDTLFVTAELDSAQLVRVTPEAVTIQLFSGEIGDAFVTLRRGFRSVTIQHGRSRPPLVTIDRRVKWVGPPALTGTASTGRVEELLPTVEGFPRFVASLDPIITNDTAFSVTSAPVTTARFTAGIGIDADYDRVPDHHAQAADVSVPHLVLA